MWNIQLACNGILAENDEYHIAISIWFKPSIDSIIELSTDSWVDKDTMLESDYNRIVNIANESFDLYCGLYCPYHSRLLDDDLLCDLCE